MAETKPTGPAAAPGMGAAGARPGVLSLNIRERAALYAAYMPFLKGGGIFIPTSRQYQLGEEVFMLLSLMDDPNRIAVQGKRSAAVRVRSRRELRPRARARSR